MKRTRIACVCLMALAIVFSIAASAAAAAAEREYYELRAYRVADTAKQAMVLRYLETALVPALERAGLERIGVFTVMDDPEAEGDDLSVWMIIPFPDLQALADHREKLAADPAYLEASQEYYAQPRESPMYTRVENYVSKAFEAMPRMVLPPEAKAKTSRIYEVRFYESHNGDKARAKVHMFNNGEIPVMQEVGLNPLLYGESLTGDNLPNLVYILSAPNMEAHRAHWQAFGPHPEWKRLSAMEKYKGTVSKIENFFLVPTSFSSI